MYSFSASAEKEYFVYKIQDKIQSYHQIQEYSQHLRTLSCLFEDSVWVQFVKEKIDLKKLSFPAAINSEVEYQKFITERKDDIAFLRSLQKLHLFIQNQDVQISNELKQLLKKEKSCGDILTNDELKKTITLLIMTEVYLRARYFSNDKAMQLNPPRTQAISLLLESTDRQISHENFW